MMKTVLCHGVSKWRVLAKQVTNIETYNTSISVMQLTTKLHS